MHRNTHSDTKRLKCPVFSLFTFNSVTETVDIVAYCMAWPYEYIPLLLNKKEQKNRQILHSSMSNILVDYMKLMNVRTYVL